MPPKKKKFESTFPAARIKKIMQLDDEVGRVASSVPVVISRAVEIFLHTLLSRADDYATSRKAKTLTVSHLKYCIEQEKQWDFLKELTAKIPEISAEVEESPDPSPGGRRGRKRQGSPTRGRPPAGKRKQKSKVVCEEKVEEESASESVTPEPVHPSTRLLAAPHSNLATASKASVPGATDTASRLLSSASGPLSIPELIAVGSVRNARQEDSDDDYD